jgi:hypothetical protein
MPSMATPSIATLARALSQAITVVALVKILGFFMETNGSLVNVNNGASKAEVFLRKSIWCP